MEAPASGASATSTGTSEKNTLLSVRFNQDASCIVATFDGNAVGSGYVNACVHVCMYICMCVCVCVRASVRMCLRVIFMFSTNTPRVRKLTSASVSTLSVFVVLLFDDSLFFDTEEGSKCVTRNR
jgi:hypothetical protein